MIVSKSFSCFANNLGSTSLVRGMFRVKQAAVLIVGLSDLGCRISVNFLEASHLETPDRSLQFGF